MDVKVRKVGNSTTATLPKEIVSKFNISNGDTLSVEANGNTIVLTPHRKMLRGEEMLERYYGCSVDKVPFLNESEINTGDNVGDEVW